jgi:hypothetical protein
VKGVVFLETIGGSVRTFDWQLPSGVLIDRNTGVRYDGPNQAISAHPQRIPAYSLDSGGRAGDDNSWCNFKCSGCFRPVQASRWYLYEALGGFGGPKTGVVRMRRPENGLGRFIGRRAEQIDSASLRPKTPVVTPESAEFDGACWLGIPCNSLGPYYGIPRTDFD